MLTHPNIAKSTDYKCGAYTVSLKVRLDPCYNLPYPPFLTSLQ